jgi:hypothetical protein
MNINFSIELIGQKNKQAPELSNPGKNRNDVYVYTTGKGAPGGTV